MKAKITAAVLGTLGLVWTSSGFGSVDIQTLRATTNTTYFLIEDAFLEQVPREANAPGQRLLVTGQYNYLHNPLVEFDETHTQQTAVLVSSIHTLDVVGSVFLAPDFELSLFMPVNISSWSSLSTQAAMGDIHLQGKYQIPWSMKSMALSVMPEVSIPSGSQSLLLSNGSLGAGLLFAYEYDFSRVRLGVNFGYRYTPNATYRDINYTNLLPMGFGFWMPLDPAWSVNLEVFRSIALPLDHFNNPSELLAGARFQLNKAMLFTGGMSLPTVFAGGSGDFRLVLAAKWTPTWPFGSSSPAGAAKSSDPLLPN